MVFLRAYFALTRRLSSVSARTRARSSSRPAASAGSCAANASAAPGAAVSIIVPDGSRKVSEASVL